MQFFHAVALVCAMMMVRFTSAVKPLSDYQKAELTYFGGQPDNMDPGNPSYGTKEGSCGYGVIPKDSFPYFSTAALSLDNPFFKDGPVSGCGLCFQLQCDDQRSGACKTDSSGKPLSVIVQITDSCPECESDHIDVQALTFAKIADSKLGRIDIQYRRVECLIPEDMKVSVMDFAGSGGWIRLAVDDTGGRGSVKDVKVKSSNSGTWQSLNNQWGAAWELSISPAPPLDFMFVCDDDEEVEAHQVIKQNGGISGGIASPVKFSTGKQFTISDPAAQEVKSFEGGDDGNDPMIVTSNTPGNTGFNGGTASSGSSSSSDSSSNNKKSPPPPSSSPLPPPPSPNNSSGNNNNNKSPPPPPPSSSPNNNIGNNKSSPPPPPPPPSSPSPNNNSNNDKNKSGRKLLHLL